MIRGTGGVKPPNPPVNSNPVVIIAKRSILVSISTFSMSEITNKPKINYVTLTVDLENQGQLYVPV